MACGARQTAILAACVLFFDAVWVGPFDRNVYCVTKRRSASRYYFILLGLTKPGVPEAVLSEIERNGPKLILDLSRGTRSTRQPVPGVEALLAARYVLVEEVGDEKYFVLREAHVGRTRTSDHLRSLSRGDAPVERGAIWFRHRGVAPPDPMPPGGAPTA